MYLGTWMTHVPVSWGQDLSTFIMKWGDRMDSIIFQYANKGMRGMRGTRGTRGMRGMKGRRDTIGTKHVTGYMYDTCTCLMGTGPWQFCDK